MPSKKEQATKILADATGVAESAPPAPLPTDIPEAPEPETVSEPNVEAAASETDEPATLAEVAELLGVEVADLYDVLVPQTDGADPVSLGTLKDAEKRARGLESKLRGLESEQETTRKELEALRSQGPAAFHGIPPELDRLRIQAAQWYEHVNNNQKYWQTLRETDPAEFSAELTQARTTADRAAQMFQQELAQWQAAQQQQINELLSKKRAKLAEKDSGWADASTRKERYREVSEWLRSEGAEVPDNLEDVLVDPGWTTALYKAATSSKGLRNVEKGVPRKVGSAKLRRGSLKGGDQKTARLSDLIKRADKTGKRADKQAAATAIFENALSKPNR